MDRQPVAGRIVVSIFGGMLALVALSMTPALAGKVGNNCPPGDPACDMKTGGGGKHVMALHHGHITPSVHPKIEVMKPPRISR